MKENDQSSLNKLKDIDYPAVKLNPASTASNQSAPTPSRGFEAHSEDYDNPTTARNIAGSGNQGFGRGGAGPSTSTSFARGTFASRTRLTSKP